jgi:hypothetical protein
VCYGADFVFAFAVALILHQVWFRFPHEWLDQPGLSMPPLLRYLCLLSALLSFTLPASSQPRLSGYYEPSLRLFDLDASHPTQLENRLRVNLESTASGGVRFFGEVIFQAYQGLRTLDVGEFLPDQYASFAPFLPDVTFEDRVYLNNAYLSLNWGRLDLRLGRQPLIFGTAYLFNPTDPVNQKAAFDPTYEKPGHDAVRAVAFYRGSGSVEGMALVSEELKRWGWVGRWKDRLLDLDLAVVAGQMQDTLGLATERRRTAGGSLAGSFLGLGIWGEGAYSWPEQSRDFARLALGADYTFAGGLYLMGEYHYDGLGRTRREDYQLADWLRVLSQGGSLGRDRLFLGSSYPVTSLWRGSLYALVNLNDRSFAANPWILWNARENLEISLTAALPWGPAGSEFGEYPRSGLLRLRYYY